MQEKVEALLTSDRSLELTGTNVLHLANSASSLVVDHVALVLEVTFDQFVHSPLDAIFEKSMVNYK